LSSLRAASTGRPDPNTSTNPKITDPNTRHTSTTPYHVGNATRDQPQRKRKDRHYQQAPINRPRAAFKHAHPRVELRNHRCLTNRRPPELP
jgi:hypothetical protein